LNTTWRKACALATAAALSATAASGAGVYSWSGGEEDATGYRTPYGTTKPLDEELLVPVNIWGEVRAPGYYDVPDGTDVARLISYAGGPTEFASLKGVKLTRPASGREDAVNIDYYLDTGDVAGVPVLQPGDTVYVPRNTKYAWREFIKVVSELAVIAGTVILYIKVAEGD
jgi:hypothetical protein